MSNVHINEFGCNFAHIRPRSTVSTGFRCGPSTVVRGPSFKSLNHLNQYNYGK